MSGDYEERPSACCRESANVEVNGQELVVHEGATRLRSGHPLVKARPDLFEPVKGGKPKRAARGKPKRPIRGKRALDRRQSTSGALVRPPAGRSPCR